MAFVLDLIENSMKFPRDYFYFLFLIFFHATTLIGILSNSSCMRIAFAFAYDLRAVFFLLAINSRSCLLKGYDLAPDVNCAQDLRSLNCC